MPTPSALPPTAHDVYLARQPIFDAGNRCVAYELLYRASSAGGLSVDVMCNDTALHAVVSIGLDRLTGGAPAWVNVGREHLVGDLYGVFPPRGVVLELLETITPDDTVIEAARRAVRAGYRIALDDFEMTAPWAPLLELAQIVKVDVLGHDAHSLALFIAPRRTYPHLKRLAERVETGSMRLLCGKLGCQSVSGVLLQPSRHAGRAIALDLQ
jgi:EAL and modified HD-GYP domain-containing signal transduction protein